MPTTLARVPTNTISWNKGEQFFSITQGSNLNRSINALLYNNQWYLAECSGEEEIVKLWKFTEIENEEDISNFANSILNGTYDE